MTRRNFLRLGAYGIPAGSLSYGSCIERKWLRVRHVRLHENPTLRLAHFSDLHYKGDQRYLSAVIQRINDASPDFACFTGDIVETVNYLPGALDLLSGMACPLYGVFGNHEYWSGASFPLIEECFKATGGDWLPDRTTLTRDGRCSVEGLGGVTRSIQVGEQERLLAEKAAADDTTANRETVKHILLTHYPATVKRLVNVHYDLILAGHSHGGQVRLPFLGALVVPGDVEGYDAGLYPTPAGPLYVNVGIGTWQIPVRFLCRPEITVIEI